MSKRKHKRHRNAADSLADLVVRLSVRSMATRCRLDAIAEHVGTLERIVRLQDRRLNALADHVFADDCRTCETGCTTTERQKGTDGPGKATSGQSGAFLREDGRQ